MTKVIELILQLASLVLVVSFLYNRHGFIGLSIESARSESTRVREIKYFKEVEIADQYMIHAVSVFSLEITQL